MYAERFHKIPSDVDNATIKIVLALVLYISINRYSRPSDMIYFIFLQNGKNALHISCENGHLQVAEILLAKRAYADAKTKAGETPVSLAASKGHNQIVERLVSRYKASYDIPSLVSLLLFFLHRKCH